MPLDFTFERQIELERADAWRAGWEEGFREGLEEVRKNKEEAFLMLVRKLVDEGRIEEARHIASDSEYRDKMVAEYLSEKDNA